MTQEDPSDRFLQENLTIIGDTPERTYLYDAASHLLVASWKQDTTDHHSTEKFKTNALKLLEFVATCKPKYMIVDCRHLGFELSYQDQRWYVEQTKSVWEKLKVQKIAFVFRSNLAVQMSMEGLKEVAIEEGMRKQISYRIFESNIDAANWLKSGR